MQADYKNRVPSGLIAGLFAVTLAAGILFAAVLEMDFDSGIRLIMSSFLGVVFAVMLLFSTYYLYLHICFSYTGKKQISKKIIEKVAEYVDLPAGGRGLDVGCGSGALTIACAKRNISAHMIGIDSWGKKYASFNEALCKSNAAAENVLNASFFQGNACKLSFDDEVFDCVTSNYCYHNIPVRDRQALLLETLRVLKKGGTFVIHDAFSKGKYGDMEAFIEKLKAMGYEQAELLPTAEGLFLSKKEGRRLCLMNSALLIGKK